ncbi:MAG TPA: hypothetical protein V6C72_15645, partial [Chroococcales cyanobacterium]
MNDLLLHERTAASLKHFTDEPSHALLLVGPVGIGKSTVAINLAAQLQGITTDKLANHPYISIIRPEKERSISIEAIRTLEHYMALKTPGSSRRIAI